MVFEAKYHNACMILQEQPSQGCNIVLTVVLSPVASTSHAESIQRRRRCVCKCACIAVCVHVSLHVSVCALLMVALILNIQFSHVYSTAVRPSDC